MTFDHRPSHGLTLSSVLAEFRVFIHRTLAQLGVPASDLADVVQEVTRGIDRGLPAFDPARSTHPENPLRGWIFGICERQAASYRRSRPRGELLLEHDDLASKLHDAAPTPEEHLLTEERNHLLLKMLGALERERRIVVVAYELEGVAMADVAAALGIPVNTAWNRLRLGREDLRAAWKRLALRRG